MIGLLILVYIIAAIGGMWTAILDSVDNTERKAFKSYASFVFLTFPLAYVACRFLFKTRF